MSQTLQEGELTGFFFQLEEEVTDGLQLLVLLQKESLEHRKDLGCKGSTLFPAQRQSVLGFFEKYLISMAILRRNELPEN